jgi:hypothetical protein
MEPQPARRNSKQKKGKILRIIKGMKILGHLCALQASQKPSNQYSLLLLSLPKEK